MALSLNKPFVGQPLAGRAINKAVEPRQRVVLDVAFVQSKRKFIDVAPKVLRAGTVINANQAALESSENTLCSIGCHIISYIFTGAVIDRFMLETGSVDQRTRRFRRYAEWSRSRHVD